jgi:hypothetical protein
MIAWATTLKGSPTYRSYVFSRLAADIAKTNPLRAVEWCEEVCDLKVAENVPHWIASSWVKEGGVDAMNWIMGQSFESISVRTGVRSTFRRFQIGFPEESDAWVEGLSEEDRNKENFQGPVIMYVSRQSNLNRPEHAIEWTKYIENDWERDRSLMQIGSQWLRKDEQAAEVWLVATTLVTDDKKALLRDGLRKRKAKSEKVRKELDLKPAWVIDRDEVS